MAEHFEQIDRVQETKVVLVAVDDSKFSSDAFDWYVDVLKRDEDQLVFVHVPESYDFWQTSEATKKELVSDINARVKALEEKFDGKVHAKGIHNAKFITRAGKVGEEIIKLSEELGVNYILCGSRGMGKIRRTFLGSVSNYLMHNSRIPVMVFREE